MKRTPVIIFVILFACASTLVAQFPQIERRQRKIDAQRAAEEERERAAKDAGTNKPAYPPARMNIDVQMVLTSADHKNFAEAKQFPVTRIVDGDPLWLYVKFNGTLARYVYTQKNADGTEQYMLFVEVGPQGDVTAKNHYILHFEKEDLDLTELKLSLSPGVAGHIRAMPVFLRNVATLRPGLWSNEIRLTNISALPRGATDHLAKVGITYDFSHGLAKYSEMIADYTSNVLRGTTDTQKAPLPVKFDDAAVSAEVRSRVEAAGIHPATMYFAGDGWMEYSDQPMFLRQARNAYAAFTYTRGRDCLYGVAEVVQTYNRMTSNYGSSVITIYKDIVTPCPAAK